MKKKNNQIAQIVKTLNPTLPPAFTKAFGGAMEGLTGIVNSSPKDWSISLLSVAQRIIRDQKLNAVFAEWEILQKKGKVSDEYLHSMQGQYTFVELLDFLENHQVDDKVFEVLKKIFLIAATQKDDVIAQQYMRLGKNLIGGEAMILEACYRVVTDPKLSGKVMGNGSAPEVQWARVIAEFSGLKFADLVLSYTKGLIEKRMLFPSTSTSQFEPADAEMGTHMRLTDLGYDFCGYISEYEELTK